MPAPKTLQSRYPVVTAITKAIPSVLVLGLLGGGWLAVHHMNAETSEHLANVAGETPTPIDTQVTLPEGKFVSAGLVTASLDSQRIQPIHIVPGRIGYNQSRHVEVRTPIDGVLSKVLVNTGELVTVGQVLAKISSPEIGQARAEVLQRASEEELAAASAKQAQTVAANLRKFVALLEKKTETSQLEAEFENRTMGVYRQSLQPAYVKFRLASDLLDNIRPLTGTGALSGRTLRERDAEFQVALAEFQASRDQATFDSAQAEREAESKLANARRQTEIARQRLHALLGGAEYTKHDSEDLSTLEIRAPMAGTIESKLLAENERVYRADGLFVLANTDSLYISADIREKDWQAIELQTGTEIAVSIPALPNHHFTARVQYVGREVMADTNAVPVVAVIDNRNGLLRPGMFARVALPIGKSEIVLAAHPESIFQHDNQDFVFVATGERQFQPTAVVLGERSEDWIEIREGLSPGQQVVVQGVFLLKSEWLLEGEAE